MSVCFWGLFQKFNTRALGKVRSECTFPEEHKSIISHTSLDRDLYIAIKLTPSSWLSFWFKALQTIFQKFLDPDKKVKKKNQFRTIERSRWPNWWSSKTWSLALFPQKFGCFSIYTTHANEATAYSWRPWIRAIERSGQ